MPFATIAGSRLELDWIAPARDGAATLVLLHEGLGSVALWRDVPRRLADATGCGVLTWSRLGYGQSDPLRAPRQVGYMHDEALDTLPALLADRGIANPILVGHSDGASIALIHAGAGRWPVRALVLEAPHVMVEDVTIAGIAETRALWDSTDLRQRLARHHADIDGAFLGWADAWLGPGFRDWNIEAVVDGIACPILVIQGLDDQYGTLAQVDSIARRARGPVERLLLERCGHTPHRDQPDATLAAMADFIRRVDAGNPAATPPDERSTRRSP